MEHISHGFGPWEQVKVEIPTIHKKDFRVFTQKFDEQEGCMQSGRRLRRLNGCIGAKEESACEHEIYNRVYTGANFRTVRIKYLNHAFSDGLDG